MKDYYSSQILSATTLDSSTLLSTMKWDGELRILFHLVHHNEEFAYDIKDERILLAPYLLNDGENFFLFDMRNSKFTRLTKKGLFIENVMFSDVLNESDTSGMKVNQVCIYRENLWLMTYEKNNTLFLVLANPKNGVQDIVHAKTYLEEDKGFWTSDGEHIFFVSQFTGKIELLDENYQEKTLLRARREVVFDDMFKKMANNKEVLKQMKGLGIPPYQKMILNPIFTPQNLFLTSNNYRDNHGEELKKSQRTYIHIRDGHLTETKTTNIILGSSDKGTLLFDTEEGALSINRR